MTQELSEEFRIIRILVVGLLCLAATGIGSCVVQENAAKTACIEKGGIPQSVSGNPNWVCLAPPQLPKDTK